MEHYEWDHKVTLLETLTEKEARPVCLVVGHVSNSLPACNIILSSATFIPLLHLFYSSIGHGNYFTGYIEESWSRPGKLVDWHLVTMT